MTGNGRVNFDVPVNYVHVYVHVFYTKYCS